VVKASTENEIDAAFSIVTRERAQALMVMNDAFLQLRRNQITALCVRHALPAIYPWREYADAGGLISYGASIREAYRQSGIYVGQILKGTSPAELPVQQPTKFEMIVNMTTAKILGIEFPPSLLVRADEAIE
jgi:putative tryptophan/tyrosine transport system substrate-binding protein